MGNIMKKYLSLAALALCSCASKNYWVEPGYQQSRPAKYIIHIDSNVTVQNPSDATDFLGPGTPAESVRQFLSEQILKELPKLTLVPAQSFNNNASSSFTSVNIKPEVSVSCMVPDTIFTEDGLFVTLCNIITKRDNIFTPQVYLPGVNGAPGYTQPATNRNFLSISGNYMIRQAKNKSIVAGGKFEGTDDYTFKLDREEWIGAAQMISAQLIRGIQDQAPTGLLGN